MHIVYTIGPKKKELLLCGLAGYCNLTNAQFSLDYSLLHKMHRVLAHRGPDDAGIWFCKERQIALVHRRLSIIDLSNAAAQPMIDPDRHVALVFNGEIYNYKQLRAELQSFGFIFHSQSDTEVLLYAYKAWGIECLKRIDGMFAVAIFDNAKNELYLVRDRLGIKPLYFSLQNGILSFASEIKALWQLPWNQKRIKYQALSHYLTFLVTPAPMTLYDQIYKLPAGFYLRLDARRTVTFSRWYSPIVKTSTPEEKDFENEDFCIDRIGYLLDQAVRKRMVADVPVGVFLSGGVDSSLNVALMAKYTDKLKTFNVSFADGPEYQERAWAAKVAKHFNTEHHEIIINELDAFTFFEQMLWHQDEPLGDCVCIPLYYVAKLAHECGVKVVQVGEGSDELFCGYTMYTHYLNMHRYWQASQKYIPATVRKGIAQLASLNVLHPNRRAMIQAWAQDRQCFWGGAFVFSDFWKSDFLVDSQKSEHIDPIVEQIYPGLSGLDDSQALADYHRNYLYEQDPQADFLKMMIYLELKHRLPELLLMRVDKMTMATSIEARVPFLDHKLVEFALQIPMRVKYRNNVTKYILKKACEGILPHDIIYRPKMGFAAPVTRWFKEGKYFKAYFMDMLHSGQNEWDQMLNFHAINALFEENQKTSVDYSYQLWALQNVMAINTQ